MSGPLSSIFSILILFSMMSLYHASMHSICEEGYYCPVGVNCNDNSTMFCEEGVCPGNETERTELENERCDQDSITVEFTMRVFFVSEINGPAQPVLRLSRPLDCCTISVRVKVDDRTAKRGSDFRLEDNPAEVIFPAGKVTANFQIAMLDDDLFEGPENFLVVIVNTSLPYGVKLGETDTSAVSIIDNDISTVSFEKSSYTVGESDSYVHIHIKLTNPSEFNLNFTINLMSESATECDYFPEEFNVTVKANSMIGHFNVNITNDTVFESNETFLLTINKNSLPELIKVGDIPTATVTIVDDEEEIKVGFEESMYVVHEGGDSIAPVLELSKPLDCCAIIRAKLEMDGIEGSPLVYNYTFLAGEVKAYPDGNFSVTDDMNVEPNVSKSITLKVLDISLPYGVIRNENGEADIIIVDNDYSLKFVVKKGYVPEDSGEPASFCLVLGKPAMMNISVLVITIGTSASAHADFAPGPFAVTIPKGATKVQFNVAIIDDKVPEDDEQFNVIVTTLGLPEGVKIIGPNETSVMIQDDDVRCSFEQSSYIISEGDNLSFPIILTRGIYKEVPVRLYYENDEDTGIQDNDYESSVVEALIPQYEKNFTLNIQTNIDAVIEQNETFEIFALLTELDVGCRVKIIIVDDNECEFSQSAYEVNEGDAVEVTLTFTKEISEDITISLMYDNGLYVTSNDFARPRPDNIVLPAGMKFVSFKIDTRRDAILETNETITITAKPPSETGISCSTGVIILDDNMIEFNSPNYRVDEGETVEMTLTLKNPLPVELRVPFEYEYRGYGLLRREVIFAPGVTEFVFEIDIIDDNVLEGDEVFYVTAKPRAQPRESRNARAAVTIIDNDALSVQFLDLDGKVDGIIELFNKSDRRGPSLKLNSTASFDIEFSVSEVNGTAFGGVDYRIRNHEVKIQAGKTISDSLSINQIDDSVVEPRIEQYSLVINETSLPANVVTGELKSVTVEIKDDDKCVVTLNDKEVYFSNPLFMDIRVDIQFRNGVPRRPTYTLKAGDNSVNFSPRRYDDIIIVVVTVPSSIKNKVTDDDPRNKIIII